MDFDAKLALFKKKALWKQLEGYKKQLALKDTEIRECEASKIEAQHMAKSISLAISKIISSVSENDKCSKLNESLIPMKDFILSCNIDDTVADEFVILLQVLSKNIQSNSEKITLNPAGNASDIRKDLLISELEASLSSQKDKTAVLENKIFSLDKKISFLESNQCSPELTENHKRSRVETEIDPSMNVNSEAQGKEQDLLSKLQILQVEIEEYKKLINIRSLELESIFSDNQKLKEELNRKNEQLLKIPPELVKDGALAYRQLLDDVKRYKNDFNDASATIKTLKDDFESSKNRNHKFVSQLERDIREKYTKLDDFVKSTDHEIARLRKDRDSMRQMYEQSNQLLSSCQKQLSSYQKNLQCSESAISNLTETVGKLKSHLVLIPNATNSPSDLSKILETLRADEQLYTEELENLGKSFEQLQNEHTNLIKKFAEKEDYISKLLGDKLKAEFSLSQIQKEAEFSLERAQKIEEIAKHRIAEIETREETLLHQLISLEKNATDQILAINGYKARLNEATNENSYLRGKVEKCLADLNDTKNQTAPSSGQKDQFAFDKRRLSEELQAATKKLEAYSSSGIGLVKDLEEELGNYKKLMKCNSCHIRDKNAVILKCMHCFCKTCLDIRLETRQRKCPNCGDPFGASDVKQIFL